jgi:hypothetical protein
VSQPEDAVWNGRIFAWKRPPSWIGPLTTWLRPRFRDDWSELLRPGSERDICCDDEAWLDLLDTVVAGDPESLLNDLADVLSRATLTTFHGTRTHDAGSFFEAGLKVHDRVEMTKRLTMLVEKNDELAALRGDRLLRAIEQIDNRTDDGRLHVVADDAFFLDRAAHYLIYGSEWIMAVLGPEGRRFLRSNGAPTLLEINLPLRMVHPGSRYEFARVLAREWVRLTCNETDWTSPIDFAFCLAVDIPPSCIVGHTHPTELSDPLDGGRPYRSAVSTCLHWLQDHS